MKIIKLSSGLELEISEDVMNDMELVDILAEAGENDPIAVSKICKKIMGTENRKKLYDSVRNDAGRIPVEKISSAVEEIFKSFGDTGKN